MCYTVLLSTDCPEDISQFNSDLLRFEREIPPQASHVRLNYSKHWSVGSKSGCGCTFRHIAEPELGFGPPVDWFHEEEDELAATAEFERALRSIVDAGHKVETIDLWNPGEEDVIEIAEMDVSLGELKEGEFRFFEGFRFLFGP